MTQDSSDFPAAHSMDTAWFAVDRDGHVAVFDTGESGAVPTTAYLGEDHWGMLDDLRARLPKTDVIYDLAAHKASNLAPHVTLNEHQKMYSVILFLRATEGVEDLIDRLGARKAAATEGVGLLATDVDAATVRALHERDACLGCFFHSGDDENPSVASFGLYSYGHFGGVIAGEYALLERPERPTTVNDVPRAVAEKAVAFEGRFEDIPTLQPAEHWACESWGPGWLATDQKTVRPFPGREKEYKKERGEVEDDEYVFLDDALPRPPAPLFAPMTESRRPDAPEPDDPYRSQPGGPGPVPSPKKKPWWQWW
jgi:hypothetical protein